MINPQRYVRKPLYLYAEQVTQQNMAEIAVWSRGEVRTTVNPRTKEPDLYIHLPVPGARHARQTMAFVGDWVLQFRDHFKIYTKKAFPESYDLAPETPAEELLTEIFSDPYTLDSDAIAIADSLI